MAANKYISNSSGKLVEVVPAVISSGGGSANQVVALDSTGKLDVSVLPTGVGPEVFTGVASEIIAAGAFVNAYNNSGTLGIRNADNTNNTKPAHGFVLSGVASSGTATVYILGQINTALASLTAGSDYYLGTVGAVTTTSPSTTGNISQFLGRAHSTTSMVFSNEITIQIG